MYYPLIFEPLFKDYIWGGRKLETMGKRLPEGNVAESWEIACHPAGTGIVSNGEFTGKSLAYLLKNYGSELLGSEIYRDSSTRFPLLIKLIDANRDLSVQVHPDDRYAYINENGELGKSEMWYIVDALPGSRLVSGIKNGISKEIFTDAVKEGRISDCLNYVDAKPGNCFNIPAGLVHAIGHGILICEIQQNSNTTYRVFDYDRTDAEGNKRPLHLKKALDVIDFTSENNSICRELFIESNNYNKTYLVANKYFAVEYIELNGTISEDTVGERFHCFTVLDGNIEINGIVITKGHSCLIPASAGLYTVTGVSKIIKSYVPDIEKNIFIPLMSSGYSKAEINSIIG